MEVARPEPEEVEVWLRWAGAKHLAMRISSPAPRGYKTMKLDYIDDYGPPVETMRAGKVLPVEVAYVDKILALPSLATDYQVRRILHLRSLISPVAGIQLYSFVEIAVREHTDARKAARLYGKGLAEVARRIKKAEIYAIRTFFASVATSP